MSRTKWLATGGLLSGATILGWWTLASVAPPHLDDDITAEAFKLLASVALPHLLLSRRLEHLLNRSATSLRGQSDPTADGLESGLHGQSY